MTFVVPEGDLELFVCHLSLAHQTVVQKLLHEVRGNVDDGGFTLQKELTFSFHKSRIVFELNKHMAAYF
jgi:hypothetical protein